MVLLAVLAMLAVLAVLAARASAAPSAADSYDDVDPADDGAGGELADGREPAVPSLEPDAGTTASGPAGSSVRGAGDRSASGSASDGLPAVRDVIAAALRAAGLAGNPASGWRRRARLSALVPQLSVRVGQDDTWKDIADPTLGHVVTYGISASWRLERLVYEPSELRIASVDVLRRRERRRLAWYVISLYREWRRTQNEDVAAQLDVVTDGWFSQKLANPAESR